MKDKKFVCYFWFIDFNNISFGLHIHTGLPNIEIHLPFGFIRIGYESTVLKDVDCSGFKYKAYGWGYRV